MNFRKIPNFCIFHFFAFFHFLASRRSRPPAPGQPGPGAGGAVSRQTRFLVKMQLLRKKVTFLVKSHFFGKIHFLVNNPFLGFRHPKVLK